MTRAVFASTHPFPKPRQNTPRGSAGLFKRFLGLWIRRFGSANQSPAAWLIGVTLVQPQSIQAGINGTYLTGSCCLGRALILFRSVCRTAQLVRMEKADREPAVIYSRLGEGPVIRRWGGSSYRLEEEFVSLLQRSLSAVIQAINLAYSYGGTSLPSEIDSSAGNANCRTLLCVDLSFLFFRPL